MCVRVRVCVYEYECVCVCMSACELGCFSCACACMRVLPIRNVRGCLVNLLAKLCGSLTLYSVYFFRRPVAKPAPPSESVYVAFIINYNSGM